MGPAARLEHLTTVGGIFQARVMLARLASEGVVAEARGLCDGPYPLPGEVEVLVPPDQLTVAREILLADAVDAAFQEDWPRRGRIRRRPRRAL